MPTIDEYKAQPLTEILNIESLRNMKLNLPKKQLRLIVPLLGLILSIKLLNRLIDPALFSVGVGLALGVLGPDGPRGSILRGPGFGLRCALGAAHRGFLP